MKPYYSINELAKLLNDDCARVADALVACGVPVIYEGKPADLSRWERIQPQRRNSDGAIKIFVTRGGLDHPLPSPDAVVVSADALPESWTQRIKKSEVDNEELPKVCYREQPKPMPKSMLISITGMVRLVHNLSDSKLSMDEVTDALNRVIDGNTMIYDGSWKGLCPAIDGNPLDENSGFNIRQDIISDFFNSKYWERQDCVFKGTDGRIKISDYMVLEEDGTSLARSLWRFFYPKDTDQEITEDVIHKNQLKPFQVISTITNTSTSSAVETDRHAINGPTFERLQRAIAAFPERYPEYSTKSPKLDDDLRVWLKEIGLAVNEAEKRVFSNKIAEHFKLSPDTQKT